MRVPDEIDIECRDEQVLGVEFEELDKLAVSFYGPLESPRYRGTADPQVSVHLVNE